MRWLRVTLLFIALLLVGQGCLADPPQPNRPITFSFNTEKPEDLTPVATDDLLPPGPPLEGGEQQSASGNVVVSSVVPNQLLANPFVVLGRGRAFEAVVNWRVRDGRGTVLAEGATMTNAPDVGAFGDYRVRAFYQRLPETREGVVEVFTYSARDGSEQDMVRIPVMLEQDVSTVQVYFVNQEWDPNLERCDAPTAFTREVPKTQNVAELALLELLEGPTAADQVYGARTALVPGTRLNSVTLAGDTMTADFSREFVLGVAGSCQVQALRAQVERTLRQFPNVQQVVITVEGENADPLLQP